VTKVHEEFNVYGGSLLSSRPVVLLWAWDLYTGVSNITD